MNMDMVHMHVLAIYKEPCPDLGHSASINESHTNGQGLRVHSRKNGFMVIRSRRMIIGNATLVTYVYIC